MQGRLVNELHLAGITTREAANAYLTARFIPDYTDEFTHPPADPTSAFVPLHGVDLDTILCEHEERTVGQDNVVTFDELALQVAKQPGRRTCAGLRVTVRRDVHGRLSVWHGARCFGRYDGHGRLLPLDRPEERPRPFGPGSTIAPTPDAQHPPGEAPDRPPPADGGLGPERTDHVSKPSGHFTGCARRCTHALARLATA